MSPKKVSLSFLFVLLLSLTLSSSFSSAEYDSVYDLLKAYGLPQGIIPKGVGQNDFTFDPNSGKLQINFPFLEPNHACTITRTQYVLSYIPAYNKVDLRPTISATVSHQGLVDVKGITVTVKIAGVLVLSNVQIVKMEVSNDGKTLRFVSSIPYVQSPEFPITEDFQVPRTCEADLTVTPINMMPLLGGIMVNENQGDNAGNPVFFYKGAFVRRA
uniref:MROS3A n=1 Tax=Silene latifolia TaxID=37657 RepID=Q9ST39_SILLA|nr:MROS3A [Silene latifolia]BAA90868.1 MROS3A [Silene latifolia]